MDDYAGRVLADRYRLPLPPSDAYELAETRAFDTYSGQEVLVRQVPLPEIVEAEVVESDGPATGTVPRRAQGRAVRPPTDPAVLRAVEAAQAAARIPDHPRLDQVFDVFAEAGSLWIVSERVAARPLAALLAERPLTPYRAAEVASDVLTALRVLHAHGWTHRNITSRTVLVCDDGRVVLTGLASGAAEEALCGYAPVPQEVLEPLADDAGDVDEYGDADAYGSDDGFDADSGVDFDDDGDDGFGAGESTQAEFAEDEDGAQDADEYGPVEYREVAYGEYDPYGGRGRDELPLEHQPGLVRPYAPPPPALGAGQEADGGAPDVRAARAGAIAAYRAGARAAARTGEGQRGTGDPVQSGHDPDWWAKKPAAPGQGPSPRQQERGPASGRAPARASDDDDAGDEYDNLDDLDNDADYGPSGSQGHGHARLAGTWHDGGLPGRDGSRTLSAGGGSGDSRPNPHRDTDPYGVRREPSASRTAAPAGDPYRDRPALPASRSGAGAPTTGGGAGRDALRADAQRLPEPAAPHAPVGRWDEVVASGETPVYRGPATPLAAERARQTRIAVVGAVTERWAPEQAGPVHENWRLAPPVGPATDLWALGALLYRSVQGHAPYPEDHAAELVQLVCAEPPAFAEECGALRPVVESLLRQDPTERPDFEELSGWVRSLVRSAPEPEAGMDVVQLPSAPATSSRLPVVRRRGELVRWRRTKSTEVVHGRHRHKKPRGEGRGPRALGRILVTLVLVLLLAAIAYAMLFLPKADSEDGTRTQGDAGPRPTASQSPDPDGKAANPPPKASGKPGSDRPGSEQPQTSAPAGDLPSGFVSRQDPEGFRTAVDKNWQRRPINDVGQIRYSNGDFTLIVVPGRDSVQANGDDPLVYQRDKQRELQPFRDSSWAEATGLRRIEVGQRVMAEGQFSWQDSNGQQVYVRNLVMILDGRYHIVQVIGPSDQRDRVTEAFRAAADSYRLTG